MDSYEWYRALRAWDRLISSRDQYWQYRNFAIPGQGTAAGTSNPGGLIRANSATNGRGQPYTVYSLSFIDNLNWTRGNHNYKFGI